MTPLYFTRIYNFLWNKNESGGLQIDSSVVGTILVRPTMMAQLGQSRREAQPACRQEYKYPILASWNK